MTARGIPGAAGLEQFLLGHAAALTVADATLLAAVSAVAAAAVVLAAKEATLVSFDPAFAAATGWPVTVVDYALVALVALMVVVGLPAAGAVLVTALVVIPPVAARQWTDRVPTMLPLAGVFGLVSAVSGVVLSASVPGLATGPVVVLAAAVIFAASFLFAPRRGWLARVRDRRRVEQTWTRGRLLAAALEEETFTPQSLAARLGGDDAALRRIAPAWAAVVLEESVVTAGGGRFRLSAGGIAAANDWRRRLRGWDAIVRSRPDDARDRLTIDLPEPEAVGAMPEDGR